MNHWTSLIILLFTPLIWLLFLTTCLIFWIYRKLVDITLRIKLGEKYGGLVDFSDAFSIFEDKSKCVISTVIMYKSDHVIDLVNHTKKCLQKEVFDVPENYPKMSGTLHRYRGYGYWLKNSAKLDKCVRTFPPPERGLYDEDYLKKIVSDISNSPLPQGNTCMWEFSVPEKPMVTKSDEGRIFRYPVLVRLHHVIGDGSTAAAFLMRLYDQKRVRNYTDDIFRRQCERNNIKGQTLAQYLKALLQRISLTLQLVFYIAVLMFQRRMELIHWREKDVNALHGQEVSGEKIIVWNAEDNVEFVPMVKRIKNQIPKTKFSHVVLTAVSAAFKDYFEKKSDHIPNVVSTFLTMLLKFPTIDPSKPVPLKNRSTAALLELPIKGYDSLVKTLSKVTENAESITYEEAQTNLLFLHHVFALFPISIRTSFHESGSYTAVISNVPGGGLCEIDGCVIEKVIACPPNVRGIGVTLGILTYDDRFQIGLMIDKALVSSQKEAQDLVDGIFRNFKLLDIETKSMFNGS